MNALCRFLSAVVKPGQVMPELLGQFILYSDEQPCPRPKIALKIYQLEKPINFRKDQHIISISFNNSRDDEKMSSYPFSND